MGGVGRVLKYMLKIWTLRAVLVKMADRNKEHVPGNWRKGETCYKVAKSFAELCSSVLRKVEFVSDEIEYLAEEISK